MIYSEKELAEAKRQIDSVLHKLRQTVKTFEAKEDAQRYKSQITLAKRRIDAFQIANALILKALHGEETDMEMRRATADEAQICYGFIEDARAFHSAMGFVQWHPDYPTLQTIKSDIDQGIGYVFTENGRPIGYCCIIVGDEPAYRVIDGAWKTDRDYAVVHRMAFGADSRGNGLSAKAFSRIREYCDAMHIDAIRVDTQQENKVMQHILEREGFAYCGLITFDGGPKLAYEWDR